MFSVGNAMFDNVNDNNLDWLLAEASRYQIGLAYNKASDRLREARNTLAEYKSRRGVRGLVALAAGQISGRAVEAVVSSPQWDELEWNETTQKELENKVNRLQREVRELSKLYEEAQKRLEATI